MQITCHLALSLISLSALAALKYLWYRKCAPGVYKQANFSQILQYRLDSCLDNISSSTSLDFSMPASPGGPMHSWLELTPLPSARANEETTGCCLTSPPERHIKNCHGSSTTGIADPFTVPIQEGQSHLSWHHYGPLKSQVPLAMPTQEAHQHSPLHY